MRLVQTLAPAPNASWIEFFYTGELKVVNGEVETDNPTFIEALKLRGFSVVEKEGERDELVEVATAKESKPRRAASQAKETT